MGAERAGRGGQRALGGQRARGGQAGHTDCDVVPTLAVLKRSSNRETPCWGHRVAGGDGRRQTGREGQEKPARSTA
jgi:hypothetical protein